jgi:ATP-dependent RNA helicase RhlE
MTFDSFGLHGRLLRGVQDLGFERPTPVQQDAIPPALAGRDVLACAVTGSGKTAAFGLPLLHRLLIEQQRGTRALILAPTRELAAQIAEHLTDLARHTLLRCAAIFGGVGMGPQERAFRSGVDTIVATPGRLLDHMRHPYARLAGIEHLVLDEADRMLDMGFLPDIRRILDRLPAQRQTLFFSATLPPPIVELSREMLDDPATFNIERAAAPASGITHTVYPVAQTAKPALLLQLLRDGRMESIVAFTRTKHRANRLADYLVKNGVECARIHGNRSQSQRTLALSGFKRGEFQVLVATDIAARGIDVEALSHVVNFDVPGAADDYVHRVGRTARMEATGDAITFVSPEEEAGLRDIEKALGQRIPRAASTGDAGPVEVRESVNARRVPSDAGPSRRTPGPRPTTPGPRKTHSRSAPAGAPGARRTWNGRALASWNSSRGGR